MSEPEPKGPSMPPGTFREVEGFGAPGWTLAVAACPINPCEEILAPYVTDPVKHRFRVTVVAFPLSAHFPLKHGPRASSAFQCRALV